MEGMLLLRFILGSQQHQAGSQPASTAITSHAKALGFQSLKLRHIWL